MSQWLDPETKALLDKSPPTKLAPATTEGSPLILLARPEEVTKPLVRAVARVCQSSPEEAKRLLGLELPLGIRSELAYPDAMLGQFELVSADAIAVFIADRVAWGADRDYLDHLFAQLRDSPEFELVETRIELVPETSKGRKFSDQFFGDDQRWRTEPIRVSRKKARMIEHWTAKIGGKARVIDM